jgi:hypothetical protein
MKLTPQQIDQLYLFTSQHYVEWYDLQSELVDHLANAIESQWQENPKVTFDEALNIEFKKFGVFGFVDVVEKRRKYLNKKYYKLVLSNLKLFFSIPTILITVTVVVIVFVFLNFFQKHIPLIQIMVTVLIIIFLVGLFINNKKIKRETQFSGKKWLLKDIIFNYGSMASLINLPFQLFVLNPLVANHTIWFLLLMSFLIVLLALMEYIVLILIPSKSKEYLIQTYPEYELTKQH